MLSAYHPDLTGNKISGITKKRFQIETPDQFLISSLVLEPERIFFILMDHFRNFVKSKIERSFYFFRAILKPRYAYRCTLCIRHASKILFVFSII
jgi:hypothetical protein